MDMMTIQKPKRIWQKKKDYMRKKTIRGLRRKGKRILQSFDIGTDDGQQMIYQDGDQYFAGPNINAATTKVTPYIQRLPNDKSTWDFIDDSGKLYTTKYSDDQLKQLYGYRCQICGAFIGEKYGSSLIHAHHIEYFTKSMNNDASNVLIVCPNHHGIIHDRNPVFDFQKKIYRYPNGYQEGLKLNLHI